MHASKISGPVFVIIATVSASSRVCGDHDPIAQALEMPLNISCASAPALSLLQHSALVSTQTLMTQGDETECALRSDTYNDKQISATCRSSKFPAGQKFCLAGTTYTVITSFDSVGRNRQLGSTVNLEPHLGRGIKLTQGTKITFGGCSTVTVATCQIGRGQYGKAFKSTRDNSESGCQARCSSTSGCTNFDYTRVSKWNACRLYRANTPRLGSGGPGSYRYCTMPNPQPLPPPEPAPGPERSQPEIIIGPNVPHPNDPLIKNHPELRINVRPQPAPLPPPQPAPLPPPETDSQPEVIVGPGVPHPNDPLIPNHPELRINKGIIIHVQPQPAPAEPEPSQPEIILGPNVPHPKDPSAKHDWDMFGVDS